MELVEIFVSVGTRNVAGVAGGSRTSCCKTLDGGREKMSPEIIHSSMHMECL